MCVYARFHLAEERSPACALLCELWCRTSLYGTCGSSSGSDKIKTYLVPSPLKANTRCCQQDPANKLTQPTLAHEMHRWTEPFWLWLQGHCAHTVGSRLQRGNFKRTYGTLSLGNSLCQNLNKLRPIPRKAINCLLSARHTCRHAHCTQTLTNIAVMWSWQAGHPLKLGHWRRKASPMTCVCGLVCCGKQEGGVWCWWERATSVFQWS